MGFRSLPTLPKRGQSNMSIGMKSETYIRFVMHIALIATTSHILFLKGVTWNNQPQAEVGAIITRKVYCVARNFTPSSLK